MPALDPEWWSAVSPYLDEALELPEAERPAWISSIHDRNPALAANLRSLLDEHSALAGEGFLENGPLPFPRASISAGQRIGVYTLLSPIGEGGMGEVWLARRNDGEVAQTVAIKFLHHIGNHPSLRSRFLQERQILASLSHSGIARLLDAGHTADGRPYLVMDYIDGVAIDVYSVNHELRSKLVLFIQVCESVSHAHRNLIIHRDLKPSNILVDSAGKPKLLDFGIAKILDATLDRTQTRDRILTPEYASPEQFMGTARTTATDTYSLGAVLYKLLTGRSPHALALDNLGSIDAKLGSADLPYPTSLDPSLPKDLDFIVGKALRKDPEERYVSVEAFAEDLRALLDSRPVRARSSDASYRMRKFLRRHWIPSAAVTIAIVALAAGLYTANRQRAIAQRRFLQVRQIANEFFALDEIIQKVPGTTDARRQIVSKSIVYLEGLGAETQDDPELALEIGRAYLQVARVQGVPSGSNLGFFDQAEISLAKAEKYVESVAASRPSNRLALRSSAEIAHDRMILANVGRRREAALDYGRRCAARLEKLIQLGGATPEETALAARLLSNVAMSYYNQRLYDDAIRYSRHSVEVSRDFAAAQRYRGLSLTVLATSLRSEGDLEGALAAIRQARIVVEKANYAQALDRASALQTVFVREGMILGQDGNISLDRPALAIEAFQKAYDLTEDIASSDAKDQRSRALLGNAGGELAAVLRHTNPQRSLAVYEHSISRVSEMAKSPQSRRLEAWLLAGSSYPLRALRRERDAEQRLDKAFALLRELKDYPAQSVELDSEAETCLRARADHLAEFGDLARAAQTYEELIGKVIASKPEPETDLLHANNLSRIWSGAAAVYRRQELPTKAAPLETSRLALWQNWNRKLPDNAFVRRRLEPSSR